MAISFDQLIRAFFNFDDMDVLQCVDSKTRGNISIYKTQHGD